MTSKNRSKWRYLRTSAVLLLVSIIIYIAAQVVILFLLPMLQRATPLTADAPTLIAAHPVAPVYEVPLYTEEAEATVPVLAAPDTMEIPVRLSVQNIRQYPELPNGCEATSLAMVLNYLSFPVTNDKLANSYMPTESLQNWRGVTYGPDPTHTYVGNPHDGTGYYILAPGLTETANAYLAEQNSRYSATDISGAGEEELVSLLASGTPFIVWSTMDYGSAQYAGASWVISETGECYTPYTNLHCTVLVGADEDYFYINDPLRRSVQEIPIDTFMNGYAALGQQAVVIS